MTSILGVGSSEEIALFNPAFLARLLHSATSEFQRSTKRGMPTPFAFLLMPLVLHKPTRQDLPITASSQMQKWIRENPRHLAQFDTRVIAMRPFTGLAINFGLRHGVLMNAGASIGAGTVKRRPSGYGDLESVEVDDCLRVARLLGRWFARQPDSATVLAIWRLRP